MIDNTSLEKELAANPEISYVKVSGDGHHYHFTLVSEAFAGKNKVARQQWVYKLINNYIQCGALHAINMETWTKEEWEMRHG